MSNVIQLHPPEKSALEIVDLAGQVADHLRSILIQTIHFMSNAMPLVERYALAGAVQAWTAEKSLDSPTYSPEP